MIGSFAFLAINTWIVMKLKTWVKSVLWIHRKDMVWVYSLMICKPILFLIVLKTIIKYPIKSKNWKKRLVMKIKNYLIVLDIMEIPSNVKYEIRESKTFTLINNSIKVTNSLTILQKKLNWGRHIFYKCLDKKNKISKHPKSWIYQIFEILISMKYVQKFRNL